MESTSREQSCDIPLWRASGMHGAFASRSDGLPQDLVTLEGLPVVPSLRVIRRYAANSFLLATLAAPGWISGAHAAVVHQYTFNHGAFDSVGTGHGTMYGTTGKFINGNLDLTGNIDGMNSSLANGGSYVDLPNNLIEPLAGKFSIETWFTQPESPTYSFMWGFGVSGSLVEGGADGGDGEYIGVIAPDMRLTARGKPDPTIDAGWVEEGLSLGAPIPEGVMQHLVTTFDVTDFSAANSNGTGQTSGTMKSYLNGVLMGSQYIVPYLDLADFQDVNSWLGRANWNDPLYDGTIHEFTIHNSVLTEAQVLAEFNAGVVPPESPAVPGDVNGDSLVTVADWNVIKSNMFTARGSVAQGDISYDGFVDQADFRIWKTAYLASGGSLAAIPEPASVLLAAFGALFTVRATRKRATAKRVAAGALAAAATMSSAVVHADTEWIGPANGAGNYATHTNWRSMDAAQAPGVPDITYDNNAYIRAGTVNLSTPVLDTEGAPAIGPWLILEGQQPIIFNVMPGGELNLQGNLWMDNAKHPTSALNMTGGSITAHSFWLRSSPGAVNLSGNASMLANWQDGGEIAFTPLTRITGPNVKVEAINQWGNVNFWAGNSVYNAVITGPVHSTIKASREVAVAGDLKLEFSGYTPVVGDTWDLASAGEIIGGNRTFRLDTSLVSGLPTGAGFVQSVVPGPGGVGEVLKLGLIRKLTLSVNRANGEVRIKNPGNGASDINGYTLATTDGALKVSAWNSLDDQNIGTFAEGAAPTNMLLKETATTASNVNANSSFTLGNVYVPQPAKIGDKVENLTFSYTTQSGLSVAADIVYEGRGRNNLVVKVDPTTGMASVDNESNFTIQLDGYSIKSAGGALKPTGWTSMNDLSVPGWQESNATANRLAEFNISGARTLAPGATFSLGSIMNVGGSVPHDLAFEFLLNTDNKLISGLVDYASSGTGLAGDFDNNGSVNAADLTVWKAGFGTTYTGSDFLAWQRNFGQTTSTPVAAAVPEPTSALLAATIVTACLPLASGRRLA